MDLMEGLICHFFLFVKAIINKKKINVFNYGKMKRDFTYIDDIVNGTVKVLFKPPKPIY